MISSLPSPSLPLLFSLFLKFLFKENMEYWTDFAGDAHGRVCTLSLTAAEGGLAWDWCGWASLCSSNLQSSPLGYPLPQMVHPSYTGNWQNTNRTFFRVFTVSLFKMCNYWPSFPARPFQMSPLLWRFYFSWQNKSPSLVPLESCILVWSTRLPPSSHHGLVEEETVF